VVRPGTPPGWALADHVSADEPQARRLPRPPAPRGGMARYDAAARK